MGSCRSILARLEAALRLPRAERRLLCQAWLWLLAYDWALRVLPIGRVQAWTAHAKACAGCQSTDVERMHRLVEIAARNHLYAMRCLPQALTLQRLLARRGISTQLRIGVRRGEDGLAGHAWLEHQGRPIGQPQVLVESYTALTPPDSQP